jgi:hypothetical protein
MDLQGTISTEEGDERVVLKRVKSRVQVSSVASAAAAGSCIAPGLQAHLIRSVHQISDVSQNAQVLA